MWRLGQCCSNQQSGTHHQGRLVPGQSSLACLMAMPARIDLIYVAPNPRLRTRRNRSASRGLELSPRQERKRHGARSDSSERFTLLLGDNPQGSLLNMGRRGTLGSRVQARWTLTLAEVLARVVSRTPVLKKALLSLAPAMLGHPAYSLPYTLVVRFFATYRVSRPIQCPGDNLPPLAIQDRQDQAEIATLTFKNSSSHRSARSMGRHFFGTACGRLRTLSLAGPGISCWASRAAGEIPP
jgi:hypothetical protein